MKIRNCFVSNSSSSSFIIHTTDTENVKDRMDKLFPNLFEKPNDNIKIFTFTENLPEDIRKQYISEMEALTYWDFIDGEEDYEEYSKTHSYIKDMFPTFESVEPSYKVENGNTYIVTDENYLSYNEIERIEREFGIEHYHLG